MSNIWIVLLGQIMCLSASNQSDWGGKRFLIPSQLCWLRVSFTVTHLIFFIRSKSSRSLESSADEITWLYFPSLISFCRLRNQSGILYDLGSVITLVSRSSSSGVISPALQNRYFCLRVLGSKPSGFHSDHLSTCLQYTKQILHFVRNTTWIHIFHAWYKVLSLHSSPNDRTSICQGSFSKNAT